jgi:hypothetical protein
VGVTIKDCHSLLYGIKSGVKFTSLLTLGRLHLYASINEVNDLVKEFNLSSKLGAYQGSSSQFSDDFFTFLGAKSVDTIDYSDYEGATILHDMNLPISTELYNKYSLVIDSGTLEHVFNFPTAIKNCMQAVELGGHFIGISPVNNQLGHGFYQFSPELYYRVFSEENGFVIKKIFLTGPDGSNTKWYEVADPKLVNSRIIIKNNESLVMIVIAQKTLEINIFENPPLQSDYVNSWNAFNESIMHERNKETSILKFYFRKFLPESLKNKLRSLRSSINFKQEDNQLLGNVNSSHFKEVNLAKLI